VLKPPLAQALLSSCESHRIPLLYPPDVLDEDLPRTNRFSIAHYGITSSECNGLSRSAGSTGMTRIIHERFCCNRQCLTQARRAGRAGKARLEVQDTGCGIWDISYPATRIPTRPSRLSRLSRATPPFRDVPSSCRVSASHEAKPLRIEQTRNFQHFIGPQAGLPGYLFSSLDVIPN